MKTNVCFIGGTGQHLMLCWLICQDLVGNKQWWKNVRLFYLDSDKTGSAGDSIYNKINMLNYNRKFVNVDFPKQSEETADLKLKDYLEKDKLMVDSVLFDDELLEKNIYMGFYGFPVIGATVALKELDENMIKKFFVPRQLKKRVQENKKPGENVVDRLVLVGSSIGGTGLGVGPALVNRLKEYKDKKKYNTEIVLLYYVGYMKTVEENYIPGINTVRTGGITQNHEANGEGEYGENEEFKGEGWANEEDESTTTVEDENNEDEDVRRSTIFHGDFESNSNGGLIYFTEKAIKSDLDEVFLVGTPHGYIEYRIDDGPCNQNDRSNIIHLVLATVLDQYVSGPLKRKQTKKGKHTKTFVFKTDNKLGYNVIDTRTDLIFNDKNLDYGLLEKVVQCIYLVIDIMKNITRSDLTNAQYDLIKEWQNELFKNLEILKYFWELFARSERCIKKKDFDSSLKVYSNFKNLFVGGELEKKHIGKKFLHVLKGFFAAGSKDSKEAISFDWISFYISNKRFVGDLIPDYNYVNKVTNRNAVIERKIDSLKIMKLLPLKFQSKERRGRLNEVGGVYESD